MKKNRVCSLLGRVARRIVRLFGRDVEESAEKAADRIYAALLLAAPRRCWPAVDRLFLMSGGDPGGMILTRRLEIVETLMQRVLRPGIGLPTPAAPPFTTEELARRTDALNAAAENYFRLPKNHPFVTRKPYSERLFFGQRLFDLGVLVHWLRLSPGETVLDFGAGSCWLSHFLNRYGCRTVAVDVSPTALELGRKLFERDPETDWNLKPEFLPYDGRRLPLEDEAVDKAVLYDSFHHLPNQAEILRELHRVLRSGGVLAMSEPGRFHAMSEASRRDMAETDVLENNVVIEDIAALARDCGFKEITVIPVNLQKTIEVPVSRLDGFLAGERFAETWLRLRDGLIDMNYLLLYKGEFVPTTRRPNRLDAVITTTDGRSELRVAPGERGCLRLLVRNAGDTLWLSRTPGRDGQTQLGAHLNWEGFDGPALDFDWLRRELPADVEPGGEVRLDIELPPLAEAGLYRVVFDLVVEHVAWFQEFGSWALEIRLVVQA